MSLLRAALGGALGSIVVLACGARTPLGARVDASSPADAGDAGDARDADASRDSGPDSGPDGDAGCPIALSATVTATIRITTDDETVLYVNGNLVDATPRLWSDAQTYTLPVWRHPSQRNSIAIQGTNRQNTTGPDRGIIADMRFVAGASEARVVTNGTWRISTTLVAGWSGESFDASAWKGAFVEGPYGMPPWGQVFGSTSSSASWLWSYDSNLPANAKVVMETVWVRRDFWIDLAGQPRDAPASCP